MGNETRKKNKETDSTSETTKESETYRNQTERKVPPAPPPKKNPLTNLTTLLREINPKILAKEGDLKGTETVSKIQTKQDFPK